MSYYRNAPPRIIWGDDYDRQLTIAYPLDSVISRGDVRDASETKTTTEGDEDAWLTGTDEVLEGDVRWIPQTGSVAPSATGYDDGWREFLRWSRRKNVIRFYPDGRNQLDSPAMNVDSDGDGVVDDWPASGIPVGVTCSFAFESGSQTIHVTTNTNTGSAFVNIGQNQMLIPGAVSMSLSADMKGDAVTNSAFGYTQMGWRKADGSALSYSTSEGIRDTSGSIVRLGISAAIPSGAISVSIFNSVSIGAGGTGQWWWSNVLLEYTPVTSSGFIDNPGYTECYLEDPMVGTPAIEPDGTRKMHMVLRSKDDSAFTGY